MTESFIHGEKGTLADLVHFCICISQVTGIYLVSLFYPPDKFAALSVSLLPGHSDSQSRNVPTLVKDISGVGQAACGSSHTIVVAQDGRTVWSFGGGDNGTVLYVDR